MYCRIYEVLDTTDNVSRRQRGDLERSVVIAGSQPTFLPAPRSVDLRVLGLRRARARVRPAIFRATHFSLSCLDSTAGNGKWVTRKSNCYDGSDISCRLRDGTFLRGSRAYARALLTYRIRARAYVIRNAARKTPQGGNARGERGDAKRKGELPSRESSLKVDRPRRRSSF